ncbi:hypothetical protein DPMN_108097 [Dreissena polymorpha]|uniref:Uncharacterized protein n=1 Tax=Dreissena polymorpha TaxID=45954 RepID=A0A9D4K8E8_DREPO|nr:hypothetical protein DPMN_108097 [Dreissena polymorpha]
MPLTSCTKRHGDAPHIQHDVTQRCHSHQAQREVEMPSHWAHRDLKMPLTSDTT